MRFSSLRMSGFLNFPDEVSIDFGALPPVLALTGKNGAGKSTLLKALHRGATGDRLSGWLATMARLGGRPEAVLEVGFSTDREWMARHRYDVASGKTSCEVFDGAGNMVLPSTGVRAFEAWSAKTLPDPDVLLAGPMAMQADAGFLVKTAGERKGIILRSLAASKLEGFAAAARARAKQKAEALSVVDARLGDERRRSGIDAAPDASLAGAARSIETEIAEAEADERRADSAVALAQEAEDAASAAVEAGRAQAAEVSAHNTAAATRCAEIAAADRAIAEAAERARRTEAAIAAHDAMIAQADSIRASVARATALDVQSASWSQAVAEQRVAWQAENRRVTEIEAELARAQAAERHAVAKSSDATERACKRAEAAREAEGLPAAREALAAAEAEIVEAEAEVERLHQVAARGANGRIERLRGGLHQIEIGEPEPTEIASRTLLRDDDEVLVIARLPEDQKAAANRKAAALEAKAQAEQRVRHLLAYRALADAPHDDEAPAQALRDAVAAREGAAAALEHAKAARDALAAHGAESKARLEAIQADRSRETGPGLAEGLARAEAAVEQLRGELAAAREALAVAQSRRAELGDAPSLREAPDVAGAERTARAAMQAAVDAKGALDEARRRLATVQASAARLAELEAERLSVATELGDWTRLGKDLGIDGIQAMLVDGLGPELTAMANDLLHSCVGPRFTVSIETQRLSGKGKTIEGCEVTVYDSRKGTTHQDGDTLSGGEAVLVGTPMRLALAAATCRHWGIKRPSILLDEAGAALDSDTVGAPFVAMLRRAAKQMDSQILFVSHSAEAQALADARLHIENGKVTVQ